MKLIRSDKESLEFRLSRQEKDVLQHLLLLYPCIPPAHQLLSKTTNPDADSQRLLDEALAEQRAENRRLLQAFVENPKHLTPEEPGWRLALTPAELDWLLTILNDVRVGNWILLGSPEERLETVTEENAPSVWAMEVAGSFQMYFLKMLQRAGTAG